MLRHCLVLYIRTSTFGLQTGNKCCCYYYYYYLYKDLLANNDAPRTSQTTSTLHVQLAVTIQTCVEHCNRYNSEYLIEKFNI